MTNKAFIFRIDALLISALAVLVLAVVTGTPAQTPQTTGAVAGQVLWTDGAPNAGTRISAIEVTEPPRAGQRAGAGTHGFDWVPGKRVVATADTDGAGRFRIQDLPPGRYHIVTGPVSLSKAYDDVTTINSSHYVGVAAGAVADNVNFEIVRNPDRVPFVSGRVLTVTGTIRMRRFDSAGGGLFIEVLNSDGSTTNWNIRGGYGPGPARYWWPGYQPVLQYAASPIAEMVNAGETVTISGIEPENWGGSDRAVHRPLTVFEVTRGGR